jgi:hypothetical protein
MEFNLKVCFAQEYILFECTVAASLNLSLILSHAGV